MLHVVGNLCRDTVLRLRRFPAPGETLTATASATGIGGKGLNQAVAAARAGADVALRAALNLDDVAVLRTRLGNEEGLSLRFAGMAAPTDTSTILLRPDGENMIVSASACARSFDPLAATDLGTALKSRDTLLMQGNLSLAATRACLAVARRRGAFTALNPSPLWDEGPPDWTQVDLLVANAGEVRALTGRPDPEAGAAALLEAGAGAVAVTLGGAGALLLDRAGRLATEAPSVAVRDTTGAGDVFCGVLVALLIQGLDRGPALVRAVAAASLSVTRLGALDACPTRAELAGLDPLAYNRSPP